MSTPAGTFEHWPEGDTDNGDGFTLYRANNGELTLTVYERDCPTSCTVIIPNDVARDLSRFLNSP